MAQQSYRLVQVGREVSGDPARLRSELATYWSVTVAYVEHETGVDLAARIIQAQGGSQLSAGTHWDGAAVDLRTRGLTSAQIAAVVAALRELGWAAWFRDWVGNQHIHAAAHLGWSVATGCLYQVRAYKAGFNGLGSMGRGGTDPHPRPDTIRTIQQGAVWAAKQLGTSPTPTPTPTPTPQEDDMTPEQDALLRQINLAVCGRAGMEAAGATAARHVWSGTSVQRGGKPVAAIQELADTKTGIIALQGSVAGLTAALQSMAAGQGVDLAAVEAAAKRGVEAGLAGATVTVELG